MTTKKKLGTVCFYVVAILLAVIAMIPFLWMISTSFKSRGALMSIPIQWITDPCRLYQGILQVSLCQNHWELPVYLCKLYDYYAAFLLHGGFRVCKAPVFGEQPAPAVLSCNHDDSNPSNDDSVVRRDESHGAY